MSHVPAPEIARKTFSIARLMAEHPPRWQHANKTFLFGLACPQGATHEGELLFTRRRAMALPDRLTVAPLAPVDVRPEPFTYAPSAAGEVDWHMNFAHWDLFCSYGFGLFAQDEMQVAEHPALGALREALLVGDIKPFTVDMNEPTPILIRGAPRHVAVATDPNEAEGRPAGLYGNAFTKAKPAAIERATRRIDPPTLSNVLAMEAPTGGPGAYSKQDIAFVLRSALTGYAAAREESAPSAAVVHTGYWGCGAYGGNRVLMALLQMIAATATGVRLAFHTVTASATGPVEEAGRGYAREIEPLGPTVASDVLLSALAGLRYEWGVGDGN